jgi:hypothetical protein
LTTQADEKKNLLRGGRKLFSTSSSGEFILRRLTWRHWEKFITTLLIPCALSVQFDAPIASAIPPTIEKIRRNWSIFFRMALPWAEKVEFTFASHAALEQNFCQADEMGDPPTVDWFGRHNFVLDMPPVDPITSKPFEVE